MVAVTVLLGIFLCVLGTCKGSVSNSELSDRLDRLEALYENFESLINENGVELQQLLDKARAKAQLVKAIDEDQAEPEVDTEKQPEDEVNKRQILTTFAPSSTTSSRASNPLVFHATLSTSYSIMSPKQTIVYNTVITNVGNAYDSNFGVFKATAPGLYEFIATVSAYTGYYVDVEMVLNNRMLCRAHAGAPDMEIGMCVSMVHLNTGDDVFVRHYSGRGTYIYGGYNYPSFSGHLIARD
ncbi:heavy metal-binding protein HIP-like [Mizuhopecten yessoensis]|uniref:Cerebellin-1 n=1 Tax=Mizuhopecten yessoensis TaxID=6573 RepID=A0A210QVT3_MIZYE|nr:heavy metal-binding protein HIP-like [Mizuhopecten yessoensis]OWF52834.1 Cerebellin-1 [Mizuhopecten yessoensis]